MLKKVTILIYLFLIIFNFSNAGNVTNAIRVNIDINDAQFEFINENYDFVLTTTLSEEFREKIQNPELFLYRSIQGTWTDFEQFDWEHITSNENMFCHYDSLDQSENTRILTVWNSWLMNGNDLVEPTEPDALNHWINYYAVTASTQVYTYDYDGLFIDSAGHQLGSGALEDPSQMPWDYDDDEWREGRQQSLQFIKSHFLDKIVIFNGLHGRNGADSSLTFTDGGMWEDFGYDINDGYYKGIGKWWFAIECMQDNNEDNLLSLVVKKPELIGDYQARMFSVASYLLIANENVALSLSDFQEPIHRMIQYYPEYDISLGSALGDFETLDTLFVREFEDGLVLVNPTETNTKIFNLENDYFKIIPVGGGIIDSTLYYDGELTYEPVESGEIEIPPVSGLVLISNSPSQTEVSGNQSGIWEAENSPFLVVGEITVPSGEILEIEAGVEVNFQGHYKFNVNGNLQAIGTEADSIFFTTDNPAIGWGGIRVDSDDIINLSYCRIEFGKTSGEYPNIHGGGMALLTSNAIVENCVFADNDATGSDNGMGGAIYAINTGTQSETLTRFTDCKFIRNHAYGEGGAIKFTSDGHTEITNCEFIQNDCNYGGGAISFYSVMGTKMTGCLFVENYTMYSSGGAFNTLGIGNYLYFVNCTITGNSAVTGDGGAANLAYAEAYFVNTIVYDNPGMYSDDINADWGSAIEVYYSNLSMPDGATGHHNIETNPLFADNWTLQENSPCIDTGVAYLEAGGEILVDLSENEFAGDAPDMGAFEWEEPTEIDVLSTEIPAEFGLSQNYPNPFSTQTFISYAIHQPSNVKIEIYNIKGQLIETVVDKYQGIDNYSVTWDAESLSSGIYFYRLTAGNKQFIKKMVLMR